MDSTLVVLSLSSIAAVSAVLGIVPLLRRRDLPTTWIGWANALAAGLMLGAAYVLSTVRPDEGALPTAIGALLGALTILGTHRAAGTAVLELNEPRSADPAYSYKVLLVNGLHSAFEGVAIGLAMVIDLQLGIFLALAIAVHNVPEATVLSSILTARGATLAQAAGLAVAVNIGQILLAVVTYAVLAAASSALPWVVGFAVGALVQLVLMELLPESYQEAGATTIAVVTVVVLGVVVLAQGLVP